MLLVCLLALGATYGRAWYRLRRSGDETAMASQPLAFGCGLGGIALLTASPLDDLGMRALFIARMAEYILLAFVLPNFLWLGLPPRWLQRLAEKPGMYRLRPWLLDVVPPALGFNLLFLLWHLPPFFELALHNALFNQLQLLVLCAGAMVMWAPLSCSYAPLRLPMPRQMFYLVLLILVQVPVFAMLTFSREALYVSYQLAPRLFSISAYGDQQLGGWMLKTVTAVIFAAAGIRIFLDWNQRARRTDREENVTAFENFDLVKRADRRQG